MRKFITHLFRILLPISTRHTINDPTYSVARQLYFQAMLQQQNNSSRQKIAKPNKQMNKKASIKLNNNHIRTYFTCIHGHRLQTQFIFFACIRSFHMVVFFSCCYAQQKIKVFFRFDKMGEKKLILFVHFSVYLHVIRIYFELAAYFI